MTAPDQWTTLAHSSGPEAAPWECDRDDHVWHPARASWQPDEYCLYCEEERTTVEPAP